MALVSKNIDKSLNMVIHYEYRYKKIPGPDNPGFTAAAYTKTTVYKLFNIPDSELNNPAD